MLVANGSRLERDQLVLVTGGHGLLGKTLQSELRAQGFENIIAPKRNELDYLDLEATRAFFSEHRPHVVFHLASVVFGLLGNMENQVRAIADSTIINHNVFLTSAEMGVKKIFFAGSVASYPFPYTSLPLREDMLWQGVPHAGEFGYAHAKRHALAYLELLRDNTGLDFFYGILTNLYGPNDRFDDAHGHVIPSLIRKMHRAIHDGDPFKVWGSGVAKRDFMHARDAAAAIIAGMDQLSGVANISSGESVTIRNVVEALVKAAHYKEEIIWEVDKPVGVPDRSVSNEILREIGFRCSYGLDEGIRETWEWFENHILSARL
ncbi:NAD-dependent epimerase/dehydratase family protein [Acetobacter fallax]|uniref:NAD-dependent epimerase/dehydratase family protein n=1 Tax=Acetobacter fallax TaxID=1737473 RepID=UPI00156ADFB5